MCFFIFKSEAKPSLRAFGGDLTGSQLPSQFRPWRAVGAVAPGQQPPYKLPRDVIKGRLRPKAFNFFVLAKPNEQSPREMCEDEASALRLSLKSGGAAQTADGYSKIGLSMSKEELLQFEGLVLERMPNARYLVQLDNRHQLVAYTAGRMKKNRIKTLAEDRVTVEVSLYDLEKGRLIFRHKDERTALVTRQPQRSQFRRR